MTKFYDDAAQHAEELAAMLDTAPVLAHTFKKFYAVAQARLSCEEEFHSKAQVEAYAWELVGQARAAVAAKLEDFLNDELRAN